MTSNPQMPNSAGTKSTLFVTNQPISRQAKSFDFYILFSTPSYKISNRKLEQSEKGLPCLPSVALAKVGAQPKGPSDSGEPPMADPVLLIPDIPHPDFLVT